MVQLVNRILAAPYIDVGETSEVTSNAGFTVDVREPVPDGWDWASDLVRPGYLRVKADATGWLRVDTELSSTLGSYLETVLSVWWRNPDTGVFEEIATDDGNGSSSNGNWYTSALSFKAGVDATYFIQVTSYADSPVTNYVVRVQETTAPVQGFHYVAFGGTQGSDSFANAPQFMLGYYSTNTTTSLSVEAGEPVDYYYSSLVPDGPDSKSMWWKVTPPATGLVDVYCSSGMISLFTGTSFSNLDLVQMRWDGTFSCSMKPYVEEGVTYYLRWSNAGIGSSTPTTVTIGLSEVLPVTEVHSPFLNPRFDYQNYIPGGDPDNPDDDKGAIVGGSTALADGSDATWVELWPSYYSDIPNDPEARNKYYSFDLNPIDADPTLLVGVHWRIRGRLIGAVPYSGSDGPCLSNFFNGDNTITQYSNQAWRWKPDEWKDRVQDLTTGSDNYLIPSDMLFGGTSAEADPNDPLNFWVWGDGVDEKAIDLSWFGYNIHHDPTTYALVSECEFIVYLYDDTFVEVKPPDTEGAIDGLEDLNRAAFSTS